nr:flagellin [Rhizobium sp. P32RR-XVIII]
MRSIVNKAGLSSDWIDYYSNLASNGGATVYNGKEGSGWMRPEWNSGSPGVISFDDFPVGSPLDFNLPGAQIQFDLILDKEASNPPGTTAGLGDLPGPYYAGYSRQITITKADVDAYEASLGGVILGGVISTNTQFAGLLNSVLHPDASVPADAYVSWDLMSDGAGHTVPDPKTINITTRQQHGNGSYVEIAKLSSVGVSTGGLQETSDFGTRGSGKELGFKPFIVYKDGDNEDGINVSFTLSVNGNTTTHSFNRTYVNEVLGKDTGKVETAEEWATLLHSMLDPDYGNSLVIEATDADHVMVKSNPAVDRKWGSGTHIEFSDISVSSEPRSTMNFLDIDVAKHPEMLDDYIDYINVVTTKITDGTAALGSIKKRLELQTDFTSKLMDSMDSGVGKLVDANMEEESSKLSALQTQKQLAIQSLSIANSNAANIMQLFR